MSGTQRRTPPAVIGELLREPHRFGFFQAVRLLQRWLGRAQGMSGQRVLEERLRFRNSLALDFPASEVEALRVVPHVPDESAVESAEAGADAGAHEGADQVPDAASIHHVEITPTFMGLLGVMGTLPNHYTETLAQRELYQRDKAARAFLDIFQHRAVALFYEGWRKHRLPLHDEADGRNRFLPLMLAVAGLGQPSLRDRLRPQEGGMSDHAVAFYAGVFQKRNLSREGLQRAVAMYFGVPVRLTPFIGRWYQLPASQRALIGLGHATLGRDALVGERVWQRDLRVRLDIGPLDLYKFRRFLPGGPAALALKQMLQLMSGSSLEYEVRLHLKADEVRSTRLDAARGSRLGWDSFLITKLQREDRSDAGYDLLALA
jgi:type VI secretion system protein ImpH